MNVTAHLVSPDQHANSTCVRIIAPTLARATIRPANASATSDMQVQTALTRNATQNSALNAAAWVNA